MKKLLCIPLLLMLGGLAFGQGVNLPPCNANAATPVTTNCTDYFGVGNYANSPLPAGTITGFTLIAGGSGYVNPVVVIADPTGTGATATATPDASGVITAITGSGGSGYIMPQVTIVDVGAGGAIGAATCDLTGQPACGTGAMATAIIGPPFTGGVRKFMDPLGNLPIAVPDTITFPGSDYYVIALTQYPQKMHTDLPPTTVRGYCQLINGVCAAGQPSYLGPLIVAQKNRPVRVLFKNMLPTGAGGNLFIPVDTTYMGAGPGFTQNRATLHLHGGATPWISDGTPHQWTVPQGEAGGQQRGASTQFVPDMFFDASGNQVQVPACSATVTTNCYPNAVPAGVSNDPGVGAMTFYWTNQQGGRLMFYHDHAYGITRLNVYAGEAAGYLLYDPAEEAALAAATVPGTVTSGDLAHLVPLVIQDKTFVPPAAQLAAQDPTWTAGGFGTTPSTANVGDLWFPHVYMTNQDPSDPGGANGFGRWDYGPWFFPPQTSLSGAGGATTFACTSSAFPAVNAATPPPQLNCPITPNPSGTPEAFMDTPVVNGTAYPVLHVAPAAYRFQILSAGNDRSWNLSWFIADPTQANKEVAMLPAVPPATGAAVPLCTAINPVAIPSLDMGLATALLDASGNPLNGTGLPAGCWPNYGAQAGIPKPQTMWAADGRMGGAPDPRTAGPPWIQIGSEGGLLPAPVVIPATPANYEQNTRSITVTNVAVHGLWLGPAERADVIVDFSAFSGKTLILYNDAPAPVPAFDSRLDYFTGDGDQSPIGGAPNTQPGYGPNTRTVMQVVVDGTAPNTVPFSLTALKGAFAGPTGMFTATQPTIIVPEAAYNSNYAATFPNTYSTIQATSLSYTPIGGTSFTQPMEQKTIQELFTLDYGRMNATLGVELPLTNFLTQTTIPYGYIDPPTEIIQPGQSQLWKITHNGVDTHFIHFHLFNVQVVNRMGWDGTIRPPDPNENGWKDTVRMNPLEDIVVALQPILPILPWPVPDSVRFMDVTMPAGSGGFTGVDPSNNPITVTNAQINFGWEYVWHCHILGHEENDMMRPMVFQVAPLAPSNLNAVTNNSGGVTVTWTDNSASESGFNLQRDTDPAFPAPVNLLTDASPSSPKTAFGGTITYTDTASPVGQVYYRVQAEDDFTPASPLAPPFQAAALTSAWVGPVPFTASPIAGVTPPALSFGNVLVGSTGGPMSVTLSNTGTATLTINSIGLTGTNLGDFALPVPATTPCGATLAPATTCTISVTFTPTAVGARSASVTISSNDPVNATLNVTLTGTGIANTTAAITAPAITYGQNGVVTISVTSPQVTPVTGTVTLSVDGAAAVTQTLSGGSATFNSTNTPALLAPNAPSHTLTVNYAAQGGFGASSITGTLTVSPAPLTITASSATMIYGGPVPPITPTYAGFVLGQGPANLTGTVTCATTATSTSSVGGNPYSSSCAGATSTNYAIKYVPGAVTINQAATTTTITSNLPNPAIVGQVVTVTFASAPQFTGVPTGSVKVTASTGETCTGALTAGAGSCPLTFATGGSRTLTAVYSGDTNFVGSTSAAVTEVISSVSLTTRSLLFGNQLVGTTSASQAITLANVGTTALAIRGITIAGTNPGDFTQSNNCPIGGTLAAGRNCRINVSFRPTATGVRTANLTITDADVTSPQLVSLTGTGIQPAASLSPASFSFGAVTTGQSRSNPFTLTNSGTGPLTINNISFGGPNSNRFSQTNNCGGSLAAGASCTINVTFSPNKKTTYSVTLQVSDNAPGSPQTAALTGTGQ